MTQWGQGWAPNNNPYGRHALNERVTLWGVAGYGAGSLKLTPKPSNGAAATAMKTDIDLMLTAAGLRGAVVEAPADGGPALAAVTDAMVVRTTSAAAPGLPAAEADVTRLRLGLEGTWRGLTPGGGELTPRLEVGVRHDGGDAETGFGLDVGTGLAWSDPESGVTADFGLHGLLTHDAGGFREQGYSGSLTWDPRPDSDRGVRLSLRQTQGAPGSGSMDALLARGTIAGRAANDDGGDELQQGRIELKLGHGFSALGDRFTSTLEFGLALSDTGRDYSLGWRLTLAERGANMLDLHIENTRRESANDDAPPEHGVVLRLSARY